MKSRGLASKVTGLLLSQLLIIMVLISSFITLFLYLHFKEMVFSEIIGEYKTFTHNTMQLQRRPVELLEQVMINHSDLSNLPIARLDKIIDLRNYFEAIIFLDNWKVVDIALPVDKRHERSLFIGNNLTNIYASHFEASKEFIWSGVMTSVVSGRPVLGLYRKNNSFQMLALIRLELLSREFVAQYAEKKVQAMVVDQSGFPLFSIDTDKVRQRESDLNFVNSIESGIAPKLVRFMNSWQIVFKGTIADTPWHVVIYKDLSDAFHSAGIFIGMIILSIILILLLTQILFARIVRSLDSPLKKLGEQFSLIEKGHFASVKKIKTGISELDSIQDKLLLMSEVIKNREDELAERYEQASRDNEAKAELLAKLSHEVRNPLNIISGFFPMLWGDRSGDEVEKHRALIQQNIDHLEHIVDQVMTHSTTHCQVKGGALRLLSLSSLFDGIASSLDVKYNAHSRLKFEWLPMDPDRQVIAAIDLIRLVLRNIIENALKFSEDKMVSIQVSLSPKHDMIHVTVDDQGKGIADVSKIFEPFYQEEAYYQRKHSGLGLGVAESQKILAQIGGTIEVHSNVGKGTSIRLNFPCSSSALSTPSTLERQMASVLVVDDDLANRKLVETILRSFGEFTIYHAENGDVAIQALADHEMDLILMDIQMPVMDGISATRKIRELGHSVPIIGVSAHGFEQHQIAAYQAGMNGYLVKPVKKAKMQSIIANYIKVK